MPTALADAHRVLHETANTAAAQAHKIIGDTRISETERASQLSGLCESTVAEITKLDAVIGAVSTMCDENEANALRTSIARYDANRLLSIANVVASRPREGRMSALLRARGDREAAAALLSAPAELGVLDGIDPRLCDILRDVLIGPETRKTVSDTRFVLARLKHGREAAVRTLRRLPRTEQSPRDRIVRPA